MTAPTPTALQRRFDKPTLIVLFISGSFLLVWLAYLSPLERNPYSILSLTDGSVNPLEMEEPSDPFDYNTVATMARDISGSIRGSKSTSSGETTQNEALDLTGSDSPEDQCDHSGKPTLRNRRSGRLFGSRAKRGKRRKCPMILQESMVNVSMLYNEQYVSSRRLVAKRVKDCADGTPGSKTADELGEEERECQPELVAVVSSCPQALATLAETAKRAQFKFRMIWSYRWGGSGHRIRIAHAYLKTLPPKKLVVLSLVADDAELLLLPHCTPKVFSKQFQMVSSATEGIPVIAAAEKKPWPDVELTGILDEIGRENGRLMSMKNDIARPGVSAYMYPNGGLLIGEVWALIDVLSSIYISDCDENSSHPIGDRPNRTKRAKSNFQAKVDVARFISRAYVSGLAYKAPHNASAGAVKRYGDGVWETDNPDLPFFSHEKKRLVVDRFWVRDEDRSPPTAEPNFVFFKEENSEESKGTKKVDEPNVKTPAQPLTPDTNLRNRKPAVDKSTKLEPGAPVNQPPKLPLPPPPPPPDTPKLINATSGNEKIQLQRRSEVSATSFPQQPVYRPYISVDHWADLMQSLTGVEVSEFDVGIEEGRVDRTPTIRSRSTGGHPCIIYHTHQKKKDLRTTEKIKKLINHSPIDPPLENAKEPILDVNIEDARSVSQIHDQVVEKAADIDFSRDDTRKAYMYVYFHFHTAAMTIVLGMLPRDFSQEILEPLNLEVLCLGSGPCSEAFALNRYMQQFPPRNITYHFVNRYPQWEEHLKLAEVFDNYQYHVQNFNDGPGEITEDLKRVAKRSSLVMEDVQIATVLEPTIKNKD
ncbi:hypothetical protein HDU67_001546 [Dinochytrium kinnereticum]|nr:hypothetical protein HDU67_001546 [Dinochytrium kinnereticum]